MSFLRVSLVFAIILIVDGGVSTASDKELAGEGGNTVRTVVSQNSVSNGAPTLGDGVHVAGRPAPLSQASRGSRTRVPDTLSYELAALYDEDPWNIRRGDGCFNIDGTGTLYASLLWSIE